MLYSLLYYLEEMPASVRKELVDVINKSLRYLLKSIEQKRVLSGDSAFEHRKSLQSGVSQQVSGAPDLNLYRNCLKAYVYLLCCFLQDNSKLKETKETQTK